MQHEHRCAVADAVLRDDKSQISTPDFALRREHLHSATLLTAARQRPGQLGTVLSMGSGMRVVVIGAGPIGLAAAAMFARAGAETVIFDRDPQPAPTDVEEAWNNWKRPGVAQFRQAHLLLPLGRSTLDRRLPGAVSTLRSEGAYTVNPAMHPPPGISDWETTDDDMRHEIVNARRPVIEAAIARAAEAESNLEIRRGVGIDSLVAGPAAGDGIAHVAGVRTTDGDVLTTDLVVDAMGRRSRMPDFLEEMGARRPVEETEDSRFAYYTQFYRRDNGLPEDFSPGLHPKGSISLLVIPADNGTWSVTVYTSSSDRPLRALRDPAVHRRVVAAHRGFESWVSGEPDGDIDVMAGVVDRQRSFVDEDGPFATGVIPIGDAWACTNPSLGRGISLGLLQASLSVDAAMANADDPGSLIDACHRANSEQMDPWHRATLQRDRARVAEMEAIIAGADPEPPSPFERGLYAASGADGGVFRRLLEVSGLFMTDSEAFGDDAIRTSILEAAADLPPPVATGLPRERLLELVAS
ncbi:MAG: FAD-dependent oxidoreductase [Actinobacteria bacterium]|nr:MAG: FAD-dependent oxidoreductase [Actinomycetota bacterium]